MKQERNNEAASVSPVVSISSNYYGIKSYNANYARNLLASLHQIHDVGSVQILVPFVKYICVYMI